MAASMSSGAVQLAMMYTRVPSAVRQGRKSRSPLTRFTVQRCRSSSWFSSCGSGFRISRPLSASSAAMLPLQSAITSRPSWITAGRPMVRAMIAAWLWLLPAAVARPSSRFRSTPTMSLGYRESATRMDGSERIRVPRGLPSRMADTRWQASSTSALRWLMYSSCTLRRRWANCRPVASTASAASLPSATCRRTSSSSDLSSSSIRWNRKMSRSLGAACACSPSSSCLARSRAAFSRAVSSSGRPAVRVVGAARSSRNTGPTASPRDAVTPK